MIITTKFASLCPCCSQRIAVGSKIEWSKGSKARHVACTGSPAQRRVESPTVVAIGSDGLRTVVWGLGADEQSAIEDAARWVEESHPAPKLMCVEVNRDQVARIAAGDIDCEALGIVVGYDERIYERP